MLALRFSATLLSPVGKCMGRNLGNTCVRFIQTTRWGASSVKLRNYWPRQAAWLPGLWDIVIPNALNPSSSYTTKKQNPLKNIAKCKFYDDAHHAKFQRVFRHLKAAPFLAQSKNQLPRQHHHRTVCPPNRQSLRAQKRLFLKGQAGTHLYLKHLGTVTIRKNNRLKPNLNQPTIFTAWRFL